MTILASFNRYYAAIWVGTFLCPPEPASELLCLMMTTADAVTIRKSS